MKSIWYPAPTAWPFFFQSMRPDPVVGHLSFTEHPWFPCTRPCRVQWRVPSTLTLRLLSAVGVFWVPMWIYATKHLRFIFHLQSSRFFFSPLFSFLSFFWCEPFLKSLLTLLQYCLCFLFWFFGYEACGILPPQSVIEPVPPTLQGKVLTTGLSAKSLELPFSFSPFWLCCVFVAARGLSLVAASRLLVLMASYAGECGL